MRGRDIKRYSYDWAGLWLINTHNGIKGKIPRIDINDYPAIKAHLDQFWDKIKTRADQGDTPYNLRNRAYSDIYSNNRIPLRETARKPHTDHRLISVIFAYRHIINPIIP
uniref:hypothetical protein n=1 Tax=Candidatus Cryptobacteroides bacterium TaxID=3085639 RepID=UPI0040283BD0